MGSTPIPFRHLMARRGKGKKKAAGYDPATQARRLARAVLGTPPPQRVLPPKKKKQPKHKQRELEREWGA
ncbi:MAG: hypothetical protein HY656_09510 [Acidobacteria bacterium]|nr:hypothetical protein [Acidobacteriota bacterium]